MKGCRDVHPKVEFINESRGFTRDKGDLSICFGIYPFVSFYIGGFSWNFR
ncbi:hypothetical protein VCHA57P526_20046 [Vibrio chagasii]|nr:hypothetical protein VCHA40O231_20565 [Vibrio chagasii]CAH7262806.1 hypothetical protein VCHA37P202_330050 [Vibrio chagasii]CAH7325658.1 hypothetical protein VCHA57P526_20046 [Vibrio chagasii]CAH7343811.1 hypothetical protein VCHA54P501_220026 [Vibrio chagasii]